MPILKDPNLEARWIAELRSGKYKKCLYRLQHTDRNGEVYYSASGVLLTLIITNPEIAAKYSILSLQNGHDSASVREFLITKLNKLFYNIRDLVWVEELNDKHCLSFDTIAFLIENDSLYGGRETELELP